MLAIVVKVIDSLVGHQIVVVEEQSVYTETVGQLQVVKDVPVILQVDAELVEPHTCCGIGLTVITVSKSHDLRIAVEEECGIQHTVHPHIVGSIEAVVTCTVTHIHIVGHLVLEADTCGEFVVLHIIGSIVLDVPDRVVNGVVIGEQLIAEGHVVVVVFRNVDMGEHSRLRVTDIVELRIGEQQLVRQIVCETAVQVEGERVYHVVHGIHRVGERHRRLRHTCVSHTRATVHRRGIGRTPVAVLRIVVAQGEMMPVGDIPVQTGQDLVVALVCREAGIAAGVIAILAGYIVRNSLKVGLRRA